jgi:hypothetical protein
MKKIPIVICIDVEPDLRAIDPNVAADWIGFEKTFEFFGALRPRLEAVTGSAAHFSWFVRMDPQIAHTYRDPAWPIGRYRRIFDHVAARGDEIGLHTHSWRWDEGFAGWISDMGNQEWVDYCIRMSFAAFEQALNRPCQSFRFGDHWMNNATLELVERLGACFDLTAEPGQMSLFITEPYTGSPPDYSLVPREPYRPSKLNFAECSDSRSRGLWEVPLSTCDPDRMLSYLTQNENSNHRSSFIDRLKMKAGLSDDYEGYLDRVDQEVIGGWVYDPRRPDHALDVDIYDGEVLLAKVPADGLREDLRQAGKGNGRHSFGLPLPTCLRDGKLHSIRAVVANARFELSYSPRTVTFSQATTVESDVILFETAGDPWLTSRILDVLLGTLKKRYLAIPLRSDEILDRRRRANLTENLNHICDHPLAKDFVFETPAELVARFE